MSERIDAWLAAAIADAEKRGLAELKPLLEGLAKSTAGLRTADSTRRATDNAGNTTRATDNTEHTDRGKGRA